MPSDGPNLDPARHTLVMHATRAAQEAGPRVVYDVGQMPSAQCLSPRVTTTGPW